VPQFEQPLSLLLHADAHPAATSAINTKTNGLKNVMVILLC